MVKSRPMSLPTLMPASGRFVSAVHHFPLRIYFEDTDLSGLVYHANYLRYMERARSDMLRLAGIDQRSEHEGGAGVYAVTDLSIRYRRPARLDDDLTVVSRVTEVRPTRCTIGQAVMRDAEELTDASITVAWLTPRGRPQRQPKAWTDIYTRLCQGDDLHP